MSILAAARQQNPALNDYTDAEVLDKLAQVNGYKPGTPQYKSLESALLGYDRTKTEAATDTAVGLAQGVLGIGKAAGTIVGAALPGVRAFDNAATNQFESWQRGLDQYKSEGLRNREAGAELNVGIAERQAAADGAGAAGKFATGARAQMENYWNNPSLAVQDVVTNLPQLLVGGVAGRGVQWGGKLLGAAEATATRAGVAGAVASGGAMQGSDVGNETYQRLLKAGASPEMATKLATEAALKSGAASVVLSALPGATTIERSMLRNAATPATRGLGRAGMLARDVGSEAFTEAVDEGYGQYAGNQGVRAVDPNVDLMSGVGQAAMQGAVASAPVAGFAGWRNPHAPAVPRTAPRTETGEINLTAAPTALDTPAYQRKGLDPLADFNAPPSMADVAGPVLQRDAPSYVDLVRPSMEADPYTQWDAVAPQQAVKDAAAARRQRAEQGTQSAGDGVMMAAPDGTVLPMRSAEQMMQLNDLRRTQEQQREELRGLRRAQVEQGTTAEGQGVMMATADGTVLPAQSPEQMERTVAARGVQVDRPQLNRMPTRGQLLAALNSANKELGAAATKKDGQLANTKANAPLRQVMAADDPLQAIRDLHQDGSNPRDELLDSWHKNLTGKTVFEAKQAEQAPVNSAGYVPEPASQVAAQVAAVRDGRKQVAVLGQEEAADANLSGVQTALAKDATGATAVVVARTKGAAVKAANRAKKVGLKQAMGEALGVANPSLTTEQPGVPVAVVQQRDNKTGHVIAEEAVTPGDLANVKPVPGTTAHLVTPEQAIEQRKQAARKEKTPKYGRHSTQELIEIAENTKDEAELQHARYEMYRRWAEDTDDGASEAYLTDTKNKSNLSKSEKTAFDLRYQAELKKKGAARARVLGKKFGADDGATKKLEHIAPAEAFHNPENNVNPLTPKEMAGVTDAISAGEWLVANAADPWHREVAARLGKHLNDVQVEFVSAGDEVPSVVARHLSSRSVAVAYTDGQSMKLYYRADSPSFNETTLLHELVHAATMRALIGNRNPALRAEMQSVLKTVKASIRSAALRAGPDGRGALEFFNHALVDENELLAYAFSSPTLRSWMEQMNAEGRFIPDGKKADALRHLAELRMPGVPPLTMWQKFTDSIRKLFGVPPKNQLAFEKLLADREDKIAGMVEAGKDTSLYNKLDEFLHRAMTASAAGVGVEQAAASRAHVAESKESVFVKPFADAAREASAVIKAQASGAEINPKLLKAMTLRQIDEQYGKQLPAMRDWIGAVFERSTSASKLAAEADRVAQQWEATVKSKSEREALADVLLRASVAELRLDDTSEQYLKSLSEDERAEHTALRTKLAALSPEAQTVRKHALEILDRQWKDTRAALESFITHTISDPVVRAQRIEDLRTEFGKNRGDYFPLSRFGDRIVVARGAAADGRDVVTFHEGAASVEDEVRRLRAAGVKESSITRTLRSEYDPTIRPTTGFVGQMHQLIDAAETDSAIKDEMHNALQQLFLKALPEQSGAKRMIRRENVEGFSRDALRAFADSVTHGSRYAARLRFGPVIQAAQEAAASQAGSSAKRTAAVVIGRKEGSDAVVHVVPVGTDRLNVVNSLEQQGYATEFFNTAPETAKERLAAKLEGATDEQLDGYVGQVEKVVGRSAEGVEDLRAAKALYNHMIELQKTEANEKSGSVVEALGQAGYVWYLGVSPAFWMMNTLQNPMIGIPHLGAKYGTGRASGELMNAASWFARVRIGKFINDRGTPFSVEWLRELAKSGDLKGISKDELDMLQRLEDRQVLDFTQAMDLTRIGQAAGTTRYKALRLAAAGAHHTEVFNRVSFALAAYRLAKKSSSNVTHEEAVRRAENDTVAVHFDYSYANKPMMMRGQFARLIFMFQQYRQHMLYWWANNVKQMVKNEAPGDRTRALKAAGLMAASHLVFAGTAGLPFVGAIGLVASLLGGTGDDGVPFDLNEWMQQAAKETLGDDIGGIFAKGVLGSMGLDVAKRIGQADLLPLLNEGSARYERNADDKMRAYLFELLGGPLGSIALSMSKGTEAFARGDTLGGLSMMVPKFAGDLLKAYQLDTQGLKDKHGQFLATAEAFDGADAFLQAAGVTPASVARIKADRGRVRDVEQNFQDKSSRLTAAFAEAWMRHDNAGMAEALQAVRDFNQQVASSKFANKMLMIDGRQLEGAVKDRRQRAILLALTGGTAETRRQLLIATRMSGLNTPLDQEAMQRNAEFALPGLVGR